ncbi:cyclin-dependent kinase inhibitor far1 [Apophysomyces ossiformis]|uniref:Cyclin-dependent kinase inhibitor far1 n=1 Tax=Apophysomyces ossiformis TaxID=679940 RepID=A0A8H7ERX3_9FUNG|nr:cyclin-dependent kinase inhibitor far1 [Apophysomyces ossiformis]
MEHETQTHDSTYYKGKTVLLTGATGIIGKAVLWKLIKAHGHELDKIYVLLRAGGHSKGTGGAHFRLMTEILNTKALARSQGQGTMDKLTAIPVDLSSPDIGLSTDDRARVRDSHVIIHCAGASEYGSTFDWSLEINVLATLRVMDLADECPELHAFVHMSSTHHLFPEEDEPVLEQIYDLGIGNPDDVLKELVTMDDQERAAVMKRIMQRYPTTQLFTKALAEHLILRRIDLRRNQKQHDTKKQWAIAIIRCSRIGPSLHEPYPGWMCGQAGVNAWIALHGRGIPVVHPDQGQRRVDVVPVDLLARFVVGCISALKPPGADMMLPYADAISRTILPLPHQNNSFDCDNDEDTIAADNLHPNIQFFPYIFHVTSTRIPTITWRQAYAVIQEYWLRTNHIQLLRAEDYFASSKALSKARFFIRYYLQSSDKPNQPDEPHIDAKWMDLASKILSCNEQLMRSDLIYDQKMFDALTSTWKENPDMSLAPFKDIDWENYFMQSCFGVHVHTMTQEMGLRTLRLPVGWDCALYTKMYPSILDKPIESVVYTADDVHKRINAMSELLSTCLQKPIRFMDQPGRKDKWVESLNDTLEDWCIQNAANPSLKDGQVVGQWKERMDDNNEVTKVIVLNDHRVGRTIQLVSERSGIDKDKVVGEAVKILVRMLERTQLSYVWFTGSFLKSFLQSMFSDIRVQKKTLEKVRDQIRGKRVVYVPFSKTLMDPLIVWYLAIRYQLPVPAMMLDEALAMLGPFSDLLRLGGTAFVKRDPNKRSALATSITAAYMQVLLREHGALLLLLELARSRTGNFQKLGDDGLLEMAMEAILEKNQSMSPIDANFKDTPRLQDLVFIPIHITYEHVPDLPLLVDQDLNYRPIAMAKRNTHVARTPSLSRPSEAKAARGHKTHKDALLRSKSNGRLLVGIGDLISLESFANKREETVSALSQELAQTIRQKQKDALLMSPISLVSSILLYSRIEEGGIELDRVCEQLAWLFQDIHARGLYVDREESEDSATIVVYCIELLNKAHKNVIAETKANHTTFRIGSRAESIRDVFLMDSLFSVVYLSFEKTVVTQAELLERFGFLAELFQQHGTASWDNESVFEELYHKYKKLEVLADDERGLVRRVVKPSEKLTRLSVLASFVYPVIDVVWVNLCALSVLGEVKGLPCSLLPTVSQWIGAHLISGRRTIYYEILSAEYSYWALESLMQIGLLTKRAVKEELSPDTQMLLQTLGLSTNDDLIQLNKFEERNTKDDPIAEVCRRIEAVRIKMHGHDDQVYEKSLWQMKNLIKTNPSLAIKHGAHLSKEEDGMIQLAWSLLQTMSTTFDCVT